MNVLQLYKTTIDALLANKGYVGEWGDIEAANLQDDAFIAAAILVFEELQEALE